MDEEAPSFRPSKRAIKWSPRVLTPWDNCTDCMAKRNKAMTLYLTLRQVLAGNFDKIKGVDMGMTIGLQLCESGAIWKEVLIMNMCMFLCVIKICVIETANETIIRKRMQVKLSAENSDQCWAH